MKINHILQVGISSFLLISCNSFLDETPDNRIVLDNDDKIKKILVSAYPTEHFAVAAEMSSDNTDDRGQNIPEWTELHRQFTYWEHSTEQAYDDLGRGWSAHYQAIANANQALKTIEEQGNPERLNPWRGEALIARAYAHFVLVNMFCNHYNTSTSATDLGVPYMEVAETTLRPKYERGNVKEVYEKIERDLLLALPLIDDRAYSVPKYHFNRLASYAFAARFYLFYEKWDKALHYANLVLGNNPQNFLRDWEALDKLPKNPTSVGTHYYISPERRNNLMILAVNSYQGAIFATGLHSARFAHSSDIAGETIFADAVWGRTNESSYKYLPNVNTTGNIDKAVVNKIHAATDFVDRIAGIGYIKAASVQFSYDETLLVRAEANIMLKNYTEAVADLNLWANNIFKNVTPFSQADIESFYDLLPYSEEEFPNIKKKLSPAFTIEAGTQENLLHCLLHCRRIETIHDGLRWLDCRRYGIEIYRYAIDNTGARKVADALKLGDPRRTLQIPADVISSGLQPNPR